MAIFRRTHVDLVLGLFKSDKGPLASSESFKCPCSDMVCYGAEQKKGELAGDSAASREFG